MGGCGSTSDSSSVAGTNSTAAATGEDNSLQKVLDSGKLVLGLDPTFKPMGYTDENDNIVGFDIDVAKEVCSRLGVELETYSVNWDTKEQDLNAGTIDCIWNGLSVSDERKKVMLMSEPYMKNEMVFLRFHSSSRVIGVALHISKRVCHCQYMAFLIPGIGGILWFFPICSGTAALCQVSHGIILIEGLIP